MHPPITNKCSFQAALVFCGQSQKGVKEWGLSGADMIFLTRHKRFSHFLLGRLRFGDDVASRRFAHLVSDGLPLR